MSLSALDSPPGPSSLRTIRIRPFPRAFGRDQPVSDPTLFFRSSQLPFPSTEDGRCGFPSPSPGRRTHFPSQSCKSSPPGSFFRQTGLLRKLGGLFRVFALVILTLYPEPPFFHTIIRVLLRGSLFFSHFSPDPTVCLATPPFFS